MSMNMKLAAIFILVMISGLSIDYIGEYEGKYILVADNYVAKLPKSLTSLTIINNEYSVSLVPLMTIENKPYSAAPIISEESLEGGNSRIIFGIEKIKDETIRVTERIEFREEYIESKITVSNEGDKDITVGLSFSVDSEKTGVLFSPSAHRNRYENYLVYTEKNMSGNSLGLVFDEGVTIYGKETFEDTDSYSFGSYTSNLGPNQKLIATVKFYPFYIETPEDKQYPVELGCFRNEFLIKYSGDAKLTEESSGTSDKVQRLLSIINGIEKSGNGEFDSLKRVDISKLAHSLDFTMYFKDLCDQVDMPCKTVVGQKGGKHYAWVEAYFGKWITIDPFKGTRERPDGYGIIYEQPQIKTIVLQKSDDIDAAFYDSTTWLKSVGKTHALLYTILAFIFAAIFLTVLQMKAKVLSKMLGSGAEHVIIKKEASGKYKILKEDIEDQFLKDVLLQIKETDGVVDLDAIAEKTHYSRELVVFAVTHLQDTGYITKTGELKKTAVAQAVPETVAKAPEKKKIKISLPKKKLFVAAAIGIVAIVLIWLLLSY